MTPLTTHQPCTARKPGSAYAACEYSLMSPLRIVRRRTRAAARSVIGGGGVSAAGGSWSSGLVRPVLVVVDDVLAQRGDQVPFAMDQDMVQALPPGRAYPPFRERVRSRRPRRGANDPHALRGEDRVERAGELRVPVADQEPELASPLAQIQHQVAGLLGHPLPRRMRRGTKQMHPAGGDLHDEQDVDPLEADRVDVQEVAGQNPFGLRGEELGPGWSGPSGCGIDAGGVEDLPHRAGANPVAQPDQLAMDAPVAPGRVLRREPQHQRADLRGDARPARPTTGIRPAPSDQVAVPTQQRGRGDEERRPPRPRQQPRQRRQHHPVRGFQVNPGDLTPQDRDLMAQHENLDLVGAITPRNERQELQSEPDNPVPERHDHGRQHPRTRQAGRTQSCTSDTLTGFTGGTARSASARCQR